MVDKKEEEYIKNIKSIIDAIKRNPEDQKVFQLADTILSICKKIENKELAKCIKEQIITMTNTIDVALRLQAIVNIEKELSSQKEVFEPKIVEKTKQYKADCKKYQSQANIEAVERKIVRFPHSKKLHEMIAKRKWKRYLHARLTNNLRIMYHWYPNEKLLVFEAIITKNMLEKS